MGPALARMCTQPLTAIVVVVVVIVVVVEVVVFPNEMVTYYWHM